MGYEGVVRLEELLIGWKDCDKFALKCNGNSMTYRRWYEESEKLSRILKDGGEFVSQNIGVFLPNSIEYAIAYFGILISRKTIILVYIKSVQAEIESIIQYCGINFVVTDSENYDKVSAAIKENDYEARVYCIDLGKTTVITGNIEPKKAENGEDVAIMLHTSGTTSSPKRVMLTHENLLANVRSNISSLQLNSDDKVLIWVPMMFGYCNTAQFLTHLYLGATMVIMNEVFMPKRFFEVVQNEKITNFTCVPTYLMIILNYRYYMKYNISSLRYICFGGGGCRKNI